MSMTSYKDLLPGLADVIETSQKQDGVASRQELLAATFRFKDSLASSKMAAIDFPGGDMSLADQDRVIQVLEQLRDHKQSQLKKFIAMQSNPEK